jgi:plasmid stability protein
MTKMIQVRNVSDDLHKELVRRAKTKGLTLSAYVESLLEREIARPDRDAVFEDIRNDPPVKLPRPAAEYIRDAREERLSQIEERSSRQER